MDKKLLEILVCPQCKSALIHERKNDELVCGHCSLAYPVREGIPVLLVEEAQPRMETDYSP
jgi:hypothetical protein